MTRRGRPVPDLVLTDREAASLDIALVAAAILLLSWLVAPHRGALRRAVRRQPTDHHPTLQPKGNP